MPLEFEADAVKAKIDSGEITMFQAAQQFSIDPNAKRTLGELGWVTQGTGFSGLDVFTFSLEPDVVGGPVESPAGWHLVKVLDVRDGRYQNIDEAETRKRTLRMYLKERLNNYVVDLRKDQFEVVVYDDELTRRFQKEADLIAALKKKAVQEGSITEQRQKDLQKWLVTPPPK
jgi:parvulin-like peptidyl-prolyl isomerase